MDSEDTTTCEPSVSRQELLEYLLDRCDDETHHRLRLGFPFQVLGYAALYNDKGLLQTYQDIHLPCYSPFDRLKTYRELFREALARLQYTPIGEVECPRMPAYPQALKPGICKKFIVTAMRDGRTMLESHDYRFLSVFLLTSWLGLRFDREALRDFEDRSVRPDMEPTKRIKTALAILKKALRADAKISS